MSILLNNYLTRGFWGDEAWTALISQLPISEILRVTGEDFHPPLYYLLVHGFIKLFGPSEWVRLISTFFFILTAITTYFLAKKLLKGKNAKLYAGISALIVLTNPILFTYAFEARTYALLSFLSVASTLLFWTSLTKKANWGWIGYLMAGVLGVYTHYYMWFILASHGIYWLIAEKTQVKKVLGVFTGFILAYLPWFPVLISQTKSVADSYWIGSIGPKTHWEFFTRTVAGNYTTPLQSFIAAFVAGLLALSLVSRALKRTDSPTSFGKNYLFLWSWLLVPILLPTLLSLYRPIFYWRYLTFSSLPIILISLWGLNVLGKKTLLVGSLALLSLYVHTNYLIFSTSPYTMREELEKVFANTPKKLVTVLPSFAEVMYYTQNRVPVQVSPEGLIQASGKSLLDAYVRQGWVEIKKPGAAETYWLVEPGPKSTFVK